MKDYFEKITFGFMNGETAMVDCSLIRYRNSFDWNVQLYKTLITYENSSLKKKKRVGERATAVFLE